MSPAKIKSSEEARRRIAEDLVEKTGRLDLRIYYLSKISDEIRGLTSLTELNRSVM
jgi:hypothetical protein